MNNIFLNYNLRKALLLSVFVLLLFNCKKEDNFIGTELQNEDLGVTQYDNFKLTTYITKADSLRSDELSVSTLGSMNDPIFGKTESSFFTQLRIPFDLVDLKSTGGSINDIILDSVVLALDYHDSYGNLDAQTFEVFELVDNMSIDSSYYNGKSFTSTGINMVEPGNGNQIPDPSSTVKVGGDTLPAQLRLKLNKSFGQKIINESGNATISDNDNFLQFIKGIEVKVNNPGQATDQGGVLLFDLLSVNSKLTLYYRDTATKDTSTFDLLINTNCARVNLNEHDYTGTPIEAQLADSTLGTSNVYMQGLQGIKTEVSLGDLAKWKDSNVIINKAVLKFPSEFMASSPFDPIAQALIIRNDDGVKYLLPDQTMFPGQAGLDNVGGDYNETTHEYEFNITRYLNNVLNGRFENNRLTLECISAMVTPNRTVFYGSNAMTAQPKLTITYTQY